MTATSDANDIRITRIYDAPVTRVWDAWTDVEQVAQWWGPRGFTITTHSKDLRPGGSWVYTMHGPDGTDYPNFARYLDVEPYARLMYDHGATSEDAQPRFRVTVTFRDLDGKTELDIRMTLPTAEEARQTRVFVKAAGGNGTWDRLAEFLEKAASDQEIFVIARSFDAPIATVFDMWTTPEHVAAWLPPVGFTMEFQRAEIRSGGDATYTMSNGVITMYLRHGYLDVQRPHRLVFTQTFTDAHGNVSRQPGASTWPVSTVSTVLFAEEGLTQTRVTVRYEVYGTATAQEIATFTNERSGMARGFTASFDALETLLAAAGA